MPYKPRSYRPPQLPASLQTKRPSAASRGYGWRWQKARLDYLRRNPLCVECRKQNLIVAATIVDHVTPHRGDEELFWNEENWAAMCAACHSRKTAQRDGGFGNRQGG